MVDLHQEFQNSRFFNEDRIDRRSADALVGLAAGIVSDGVVNLKEAIFLEDWIAKNLLHLEDPVVNILYRREIEKAADPAAMRAEKIAEFREKFANPYVAAERGFIDEVILPRTTRRRLIQALATLETKRDRNPPKKHGNIPL